MVVHEIRGNYDMQRVNENSGIQCLSTKFVEFTVCTLNCWIFFDREASLTPSWTELFRSFFLTIQNFSILYVFTCLSLQSNESNFNHFDLIFLKLRQKYAKLG